MGCFCGSRPNPLSKIGWRDYRTRGAAVIECANTDRSVIEHHFLLERLVPQNPQSVESVLNPNRKHRQLPYARGFNKALQ